MLQALRCARASFVRRRSVRRHLPIAGRGTAVQESNELAVGVLEVVESPLENARWYSRTAGRPPTLADQIDADGASGLPLAPTVKL